MSHGGQAHPPLPRCSQEAAIIVDILIVILVLMLVGSLPTWGYSRNWGYYGTGGIGTVLLIVVILMLLNVF